MPQPLHIGIVGLGYWGPNWLRNFSAIDGCTVAYGCDVSKQSCQKFQKLYPATTFTTDVAELLDDAELDAVVIATPTSTHFDLASRAIKAGKHVLIEKPMTSNSKEAQQLVDLAKKHKRVLLTDHTFAYTQSIEVIQTYVHQGKLGDLLYFDSTRLNLGLIQRDANVLWDLAIHDLSILDAISPLSGVNEIFACGNSHYGIHAEVGHLHLKFRSGLHAHIHVSWLSPVKIRSTIIGGTKAMVVYDDTQPSEKLRLYDKGVEHDTSRSDPFFPKYRSGDVLIPALRSTEALETAALHFLGCIHGKAKPRTSGEHGKNMVRILELADESMKKNTVLTLKKL